jgi:MSHA biogenesis protein MshP
VKTYYFSEQGFAAMSAIFLIVVIAALGGFMLTFANAQQLTSAQDIQGSRAYWAAQSGIDWGVGYVVNQAVEVPVCPFSTQELTIENFKVLISCNRQSYTEAKNNIYIFYFTSVASSRAGVGVGSLDYVERSVSTSIDVCQGTTECVY